jgi:type II secretory pathway predicted ATPase ExeA
MNRELLSYFNLSGLPFTKEIPAKHLVSLPTVEQALASVRLLVDTRGIGLLTGESGCGKSCLIRLLLQQLNPGLYKPVYFCHSSVGILEFYSHLCAGFGLEPRHQRAPMFRELKDHILSLNRSAHVHPVLAID